MHGPYNTKVMNLVSPYYIAVACPGILFRGGSTNSDEDRGQREQDLGAVAPLVRVSAQFANE
jgi:hypothetical protein